DATAKHISETERRSMLAERDTTDRYLAAYLSERLGTEAEGRVSGIARFGVFVKLDGTGADGLVPLRELGDEYFHFDRETMTLHGADTGRIIAPGQRATVRLVEASATTGGLLLELLEIDGAAPTKGRRSGKPVRRKAGAAKKKGSKMRKVSRRRR
ncbi:MAG: S1 RNA-binding domain-containing protein, partial [Shimia sp.]